MGDVLCEMPSKSRRAFLASSTVALVAASGCNALESSLSDSSPTPVHDTPPSRTSPTLAHWVTVYLGEREETHDVTVTVKNGSNETIFERDYRLSDSNEAHEDAPFPESTDPVTVVVTVDGTRFERDWPGSERQQLPCDGSNWSGIELWIENGQDGSPDIRMEADCQHVTIDN